MRIFKYAVKNIIRNPFLSLSSIGVIVLIAFFINILLLVNHATHSIVNRIEDRLSLSVYLRSSYTDKNSEVIQLLSDLKSLGRGIDIRYESPADALAKLKRLDPELVKVIENDSDNPLPASIIISKINRELYETVDQAVAKHQSIIIFDEKASKNKLIDYRAQYKKIQSLTDVVNNVIIGVYFIIGFFIFTVFFIVYSIIGNFVFYYRDEIKITKLVGGDNIYVYGPFSIQGFLYTTIAGICSLGLFLYILWNLPFSLFDDSQFVSVFFADSVSYFMIEIGGLALIGLLSGYFSSIRFISRTSGNE
jgi:cell division protein FtsX